MILSLVKVAVFLLTLLCVSRNNDLPNTKQLIKKKKEKGVCVTSGTQHEPVRCGSGFWEPQ